MVGNVVPNCDDECDIRIVPNKWKIMEKESNCVRMGRKRPRLVKGKDCLICSDGFTNGVCGVNWLGATGKVFLYQESVDDGFVEKVLQSEVVLVNRKEAILKLENLHTISIVVGSLTFVDALCKDRNVFPLIQTVVLIPYNRFRKGELVKCGFRWTKVTHAMVGGVTATAWKGVIALVVRWCTNHASGHWFDSRWGVI